MKDKEKQINVSTKEEIEERNKKGKEKDELKQALLHYATAEASGGIKSLIDCEGCAFYLYEMLGYRKLPEDSVVLSRGEYKRLLDNAIRVDMEYLDHERAKERKETAEKIMALRGYITKQFHKHHEARDIAENEYKKCKEEMGKAVLNNDWHRCDAIMFILEDIATEFDKLIKSLGAE